MVSSDEIRRRLEAKKRGADPYAENAPGQAGVICPKCNTSNTPGAKFCVGCGSSMVVEEVVSPQPETHKMGDSKICPSCNQKNKADAKFCIVCGHKFEESAGSDAGTVQPSSAGTVEETPAINNEPSEEVQETQAIPEIKVPEQLQTEEEPVQKAGDAGDVTIQPESVETQQSTESPDEDVNPVEKIKEAKDLLDIGAITQEDFDKIKNKYLEKI
jgi:ribosomal protein L40E